jgi:hypothetical protein
MKIAPAIAPVLALAAGLGLAACGQQSPAENTAAALENAAEQSTPEAAAVLENQADQIREQNVAAPIGEPGSPGQQAMQAAGNAQAQGSGTATTPPPPPKGAKPHAKGDPVPPPQIMPPEDSNATHSGH